MATSYSAIATKPEEILSCTALDAEDFPERYAEKVKVITEGVKDDFLRERLRQTLGYFEKGSAGNLIQSNPYRLVVLQQLISQRRRLATMQRLRIAKENDPDFMAGFYVDGGLNLVPCTTDNEARNAFQAGKLEADLTEAGMNTKDSRLVPYHILTLQADEKSPSGLVFRLSEQGKEVAKEAVGNTADFKWKHEPTEGGLFRAYLNTDGSWDCGRDLEGSIRNGGVVIESAWGTSPKNLQDIKARKKAAQEKYLSELKSIRTEIDRETERNSF